MCRKARRYKRIEPRNEEAVRNIGDMAKSQVITTTLQHWCARQAAAPFELLAGGKDESGNDESDSDEGEDSDDEDDGQIDLKELKAFRDDDRRLMGKGVPEFIHKDDDRFKLLTPEQQNAEATKKRDGYQETEDDKDYAKLYQHYVIERREANNKDNMLAKD